MKKSILSLKDTVEISKNEQKSINGGAGGDYTGYCPDGTFVRNGRCRITVIV